MADRSAQTLKLFKGDTLIAEGAIGTKLVNLTGLTAGTVVNAGEYQIAYTDGTNTSPKVDVPAFTATDNNNNNQGS